MKKVLLLALIFSFVLSAAPALAEEQTISAPAYSEVLRDWYEHTNEGDVHGYKNSDAIFVGPKYYNRNYFIFYYLLTAPDGTKQILKEYKQDTDKATGFEYLNNPYNEVYDLTHFYSRIEIPAQTLSFEPALSGKYKLELKKIEIPAVWVYNNPKQEYGINYVLDKWTVEHKSYWTHVQNYNTEYYDYLCYAENNPAGNFTLFSTVNTLCNDPMIIGNEKCWNAGKDQYCLPKETKVDFVNENNLCKYPYTRTGGGVWEKICWVEKKAFETIRLSDTAKTLWSSEFDLTVPVLEESAAAINPFSVAKGSAENKNSNNNNSSNSQSTFPLIAGGAALAGVAGAALAFSSRGRIVVKNFKSGFTDFGKAQIEKTRKFFSFLEEEKNGYWVKKWNEEQEARARLARERELQRHRENQMQTKSFSQTIVQDAKSIALYNAVVGAREAIDELNSGKINESWFKDRMEFLAKEARKGGDNKLAGEIEKAGSQTGIRRTVNNNSDSQKTFVEDPNKNSGGMLSGIFNSAKDFVRGIKQRQNEIYAKDPAIKEMNERMDRSAMFMITTTSPAGLVYSGITLGGIYAGQYILTNPAAVGAVSNTIVNVASGVKGFIKTGIVDTNKIPMKQNSNSFVPKVVKSFLDSIVNAVKPTTEVDKNFDKEKEELTITYRVNIGKTSAIYYGEPEQSWISHEIATPHFSFAPNLPEIGMSIDQGAYSKAFSFATSVKISTKIFSAPLAKKDEQNDDKRPK